MNTKIFIQKHRKDDVLKLALKGSPEGVDMQMALQQISAYQVLEKKVPSWAANEDLIFPRQLSLEQCSSESTALYKANLIHEFVGKDNFTMADLTGGMGIDCYFTSRYASSASYVEMNPELCDIARHNFSIIAPYIKVCNSTAEEFLDSVTDVSAGTDTALDLIYLDPARRGDHGQKLISISDCQPDVVALHDQLLSAARNVVVKLSPMLDISRALRELADIRAVYVISLCNECKELLLFIRKGEYTSGNTSQTPIINAVNINSKGIPSDILSGSLCEEADLVAPIADVPLRYLYEPYAAHLKSGLYKTIACRYGVSKLHVNSHLYTSDKFVENFPGRIFSVNDVVDFDKKSAKALFKTIKKANITTRNFPLSANELRAQYKIKDGGEIYIFATTVSSERKVLLVCHKA